MSNESRAMIHDHFGVQRVTIAGKIIGHIEDHGFEPSYHCMTLDEMRAVVKVMEDK